MKGFECTWHRCESRQSRYRRPGGRRPGAGGGLCIHTVDYDVARLQTVDSQGRAEGGDFVGADGLEVDFERHLLAGAGDDGQRRGDRRRENPIPGPGGVFGRKMESGRCVAVDLGAAGEADRVTFALVRAGGVGAIGLNRVPSGFRQEFQCAVRKFRIGGDPFELAGVTGPLPGVPAVDIFHRFGREQGAERYQQQKTQNLFHRVKNLRPLEKFG
ncbi:hypothetical protein SDC9_91473 [bioreactor metagenome]|uniref:Uncharacterized protein n=1 Tax=bioreactor metagenome TaxID=1076179 RepID=A0A644ZXX7_9ZZZZ